MKRTLITLFLLVSVFCAPADTQPCPQGINDITDCPDEGCGDQAFDPELNKQKNIRSDDQQPVLRSIRWMKGLPDPTNMAECGNRDELKQSCVATALLIASDSPYDNRPANAAEEASQDCECKLSPDRECKDAEENGAAPVNYSANVPRLGQRR